MNVILFYTVEFNVCTAQWKHKSKQPAVPFLCTPAPLGVKLKSSFHCPDAWYHADLVMFYGSL